jgi:hypothetical protein
MVSYFLPKVRVHSWGGFGSQLNALGLAYSLSLKYPKRRIRIVFRTGGVHKALYELSDLQVNEFEIRFKKIEEIVTHKIPPLLTPNFDIYKNFAKASLIKLGLYDTAESKSEFDSIKPWVLVIRGSYNLLPSKEFVNYLQKKIENKVENPLGSDITVHYRLGDLMTLETKSPISEEILLQHLYTIVKGTPSISCTILSSDPDIAALKFAQLKTLIVVKSDYATPIDVLKIGTKSKIFLGTNSKISMWVVFIRINLGLKNNYLPYGYKNIFDQSFNENLIHEYIKFY